MKSAPLPANEKERLQDLVDLDILDTKLEESYDKLTALAAEISGMPICLISLIDKDRQWFKSHHGLDATETPREYAFCAHAILQDDIFEIENALEDERFADNPLVVGDPHVIFYAGAVLKSDKKNNLGTLCLIDHKPNKLSASQKKMLQTIAEQVSIQLELRRNLRNLKEAKDLLQEEDQKKTKFFATVSHDIRSAMNGISGFVHMLQDTPLNANQTEYVEATKECSKTILEILNDILDVSKIEFGEIELHNTVFDISQTVYDVMQIFNPEIRKKALKTSISIDPEVPQYLNGDVVRYKQILINLVSNAVKFTAEGSINIKLSGTEEAGRKFKFITEVEDTGIGLSEESQKQLFQPYKQAHAAIRKNYGGTGLGLYICRRLAEAMGGEITLTSTLDKGTKFKVTLILESV